MPQSTLRSIEVRFKPRGSHRGGEGRKLPGGHLRYVGRAAIGPEPGRIAEHGAKNLDRRQLAFGGCLVLQQVVEREAIDLFCRGSEVGMNFEPLKVTHHKERRIFQILTIFEKSSRYDALKSGRVTPIDGEEAFARLKAKSQARRKHPA